MWLAHCLLFQMLLQTFSTALRRWGSSDIAKEPQTVFYRWCTGRNGPFLLLLCYMIQYLWSCQFSRSRLFSSLWQLSYATFWPWQQASWSWSWYAMRTVRNYEKQRQGFDLRILGMMCGELDVKCNEGGLLYINIKGCSCYLKLGGKGYRPMWLFRFIRVIWSVGWGMLGIC